MRHWNSSASSQLMEQLSKQIDASSLNRLEPIRNKGNYHWIIVAPFGSGQSCWMVTKKGVASLAHSSWKHSFRKRHSLIHSLFPVVRLSEFAFETQHKHSNGWMNGHCVECHPQTVAQWYNQQWTTPFARLPAQIMAGCSNAVAQQRLVNSIAIIQI